MFTIIGRRNIVSCETFFYVYAWGSQYGRTSTNATLPAQAYDDRRSGFVCEYNSEKFHGFICPDENPFTRVFVHTDDCNMAGNRELR